MRVSPSKVLIRLLTVVLFAGAGATIARADAMLRQELDELLRSHPQITGAKKSVSSSRKSIDTASADYWPTLNITADAGPEYISSPATRGDAQRDKVWRRTKNTLDVTVTQNLFNGFSTTSSVKTARLSKTVADINLVAIEQNVLFEGINSYIDVLKQKRLIQLARETENNVHQQLELEDERVARGSGVTVDVLEAKRRLQATKERRVSFEGGLQNAVTRYTQIFGHAPDVEAMVDPSLPIDLIPPDLEKTIDVALRENPGITNAAADVAIAREAKRTVVAEYAPTVDLIGSWNYKKHNDGTLGTRRDYSVVLQASWEMFSGFSTKHSLGQASFDVGKTKDDQRQMSRKVIEQVRLAWQALITARERMLLLENAVNIAYEVWTSRRSLREAGKDTVINVLDAENEVANAQISFTAAAYGENLAIFQLLLAMGRLDARHLALGS